MNARSSRRILTQYSLEESREWVNMREEPGTETELGEALRSLRLDRSQKRESDF